MTHFRFRAGTTLVELVLFLAFFMVAGSMVVSILFSTSEQRIMQRTILTVERAGLQHLQIIVRHVQHAERILDPAAPGSTGSILALTVASESVNPTIITASGGALIVVQHDTVQVLPLMVPLEHFTVRNTSSSASHPSVLISFDLTLSFPLPSLAQRTYTRHFERLITLLPDDFVAGDDCGCASPVCTQGTYRWEVCDGGACTFSEATLSCVQ